MAKFEIYTAKNGEFYFRLKAGNGQIILGSEGYKQKSSAENGVESVKKNSQDESKFEKKTASNGKFHFSLKATNGQVIGTSQMYESEASRDNGIESVMKNAPEAEVVVLESED
ncbi:MAG: YegP family protein [Cytophagales bacterium]